MPPRKPKPKPKPIPPLDNAGQGALKPPLRGGIGDQPAGSGALGDAVARAQSRGRTAAEAAEAEAARYEVNLPSSLTTLRKQMKAKGGDSLANVAQATLSAARQHQIAPDAGSRLYGRAFQSLTGDEQQKFLSALQPEEASFVTETFTDFVEEDTPASTPSGATTENRAKDAARAALEEIRKNLRATEVVDIDPMVPVDAADKPPLPRQRGDRVVTVDDFQYKAPDWNKNQLKRGWRRVLNASPGRAPEPVLEVLASRVGDFSDAPPAPPKMVPNPTFGQTRTIYETQRSVGTEPVRRDVITPSAIEGLSPEAQAAATTGRELLDLYNQYAAASDLFESSPQAKKLLARIERITDEFPEAVELIDNAGLETLTLPKDVSPAPQGRNALPQEMRIGYLIGEPASSAPHKWEDRPDRRSKLGIPADAPNRRGWLEVLTEKRQVTETAPDGTTRTVTKRVPRKQPRLGPGVLGEVDTLPYSPEISRGGPERSARKDTELRSRGQPRLSSDPAMEAPPSAGFDSALDGDSFASDAEIEAALAEAYSDDPSAAPVEDNTLSAEAWEKPMEGNTRVLMAGTAQGSPAQVKRDRDFALREGKSAQEKLAEQLYRMASEWGGDVENVTDSRTIGMVEQGNFDLSDPDGTGFGQMAIAEATGAEPVRKRASGDTRVLQTIPLDNLAPLWRAYIEDVNEYGKVTFRRPTAYEIAGVLVDRANIPDPGLAARLEPIVSASMGALEGTKPSGKSARIAGKPYPTSRARAKALWGDTKPPYTAPAQKLIAEWKPPPKKSQQGFVADTGDTQQSWVADGGGEAPPAGTTGEPNPFTALAAKARKTASDPTNIATLLALLGAGNGLQAEANSELPEVEYLAMAPRKQMTAAQIAARKARQQAQPKPKPQPQPKSQPQPQPQPQQQAQPQPQPQPPQPQQPQQATPVSPAASAIKAQSIGDSHAAHLLRRFGRFVAPVGKAITPARVTDAIAGTIIGGAGLAAAPYIGKPIKEGWDYLTGSGEAQDPVQRTDATLDELYNSLQFEDEPAAAPLDNSTTSIPSLLRMLSANPRV